MHDFRRFAAFFAALALSAASAAAAGYRSFWITEAISGRTVGPVVNRPGNRFVSGGRTWIVLESMNGQINFADSETLAPQGPYDLVEQRVFDLGPLAYVFTRVEDFDGTDPAADRSTVTQARRAAPSASAGETLPERWELAPVPSTNPAAHKDSWLSWKADRFYPKTAAWGKVDLLHRVQYDWKIGGLGGNAKEPLKTTRFGVAGQWRGFSGEAGISSSAKTGGTLVKDAVSVSALKLHGGSGWYVRGGWDYALAVADGWSASVGGRVSWESVSCDVSARTMHGAIAAEPEEEGAEPAFAGYGFRNWSGDADLDEWSAAAVAGIRYDDWYWGLALSFAVDCFSDASVDASIPVGSASYKLDADRSQPVSIAFSGWYTPDDRWLLAGTVGFGSETTASVGVGLLF
ncbi:MAG: hypothetical protein IJ783_08900 [Kiritimatiellae bacterium]|nr:hypothetical protein [Kiritimatiellia bacterium]